MDDRVWSNIAMLRIAILDFQGLGVGLSGFTEFVQRVVCFVFGTTPGTLNNDTF